MRVMGLGQGIVGHIRRKTFLALGTVMSGVDEMDITGAASHQIAHVVQHPRDDVVPPTPMVTPGTRVLRIIPAPPGNLGRWQILRVGNAFRGIWPILPGTRHGNALLGLHLLARNL